MIATIPDYAAEALVQGGGLIMEEPPFEIVPAQLTMVWRAAQDQDPAERWLREQILAFMAA